MAEKTASEFVFNENDLDLAGEGIDNTVNIFNENLNRVADLQDLHFAVRKLDDSDWNDLKTTVNNTARLITNRLGIEDVGVVLSGESLTSERMMTAEGIGNAIKKSWDAIKKFFMSIWNAVKSFFAVTFKSINGLRAKIKELDEKLDNVGDIGEDSTFTNGKIMSALGDEGGHLNAELVLNGFNTNLALLGKINGFKDSMEKNVAKSLLGKATESIFGTFDKQLHHDLENLATGFKNEGDDENKAVIQLTEKPLLGNKYLKIELHRHSGITTSVKLIVADAYEKNEDAGKDEIDVADTNQIKQILSKAGYLAQALEKFGEKAQNFDNLARVIKKYSDGDEEAAAGVVAIMKVVLNIEGSASKLPVSTSLKGAFLALKYVEVSISKHKKK